MCYQITKQILSKIPMSHKNILKHLETASNNIALFDFHYSFFFDRNQFFDLAFVQILPFPRICKLHV